MSQSMLTIAQYIFQYSATLREPEAKESWKHLEQETQEELKMTSDFASWGAVVGELVRHAERITKVRDLSCHIDCDI